MTFMDGHKLLLLSCASLWSKGYSASLSPTHYPQHSANVNAPRQRPSHSVHDMLNSPSSSNHRAMQGKYSPLRIPLHTTPRHPLVGVRTRSPPSFRALVPTIIAMFMLMPMLMSIPSPPLSSPTTTAHHPRRPIIHPTIRPIV